MSNKLCGIYKIESPSGRIYIGQSIDIKRRWKEHRKYANRGESSKLYNSMRKHGNESHLWDILELCHPDDLNKRERYWQDKYNAYSRSNLNNAIVNPESNRYIWTDQMKEKASKTKKGKPVNDKCMAGQIVYFENRAKIRFITSIANKTCKICDYILNYDNMVSEKIQRQITAKEKQLQRDRFKDGMLIQDYITNNNTCNTFTRSEAISFNRDSIYMNIENGVFFYGANDCAKSINRSKVLIKKIFSGKTPNHYNIEKV